MELRSGAQEQPLTDPLMPVLCCLPEQKETMDESITIETDLFEHRQVRPHFINPCCFGEDFAMWLKQELLRFPETGVELSAPIQEDYGWGLWALRGKIGSGSLFPTSAMGLRKLRRTGLSQ